MKTPIAVVIAILGALLLVFVLAGCEGPKGDQGPQGPEGAQGPAGVGPAAFEGFAPDIKCATCHSSEQDTTYFVAGRRYQWASSRHAVGGHSERNDVNCAGCHTTEGFLERYRGGFVTQTTRAYLNPSPPGCFACHSPHARNEFSLRDSGAVTLASTVAGVPDAIFNYGAGNLCARCHQPRSLSPLPDPTKTAMTDTISITSSRWYPHYGVNSQMLMGTGGFQFAGYAYTGNSHHTNNNGIKEDGCAACHMAEPLGTQAGLGGGHTFKISYETEEASGVVLTGCRDAGCHGSSFSSLDYIGASSGLTGGQGAQTYIHRYLDTLQAMMLDTNVVKKWTVGTAKRWLNVSSSGEVTVNASSGSPLRIRPASRAGAIFNYWFLEHEGSFGVHNSRYAIELLKSSIEELRKP